MIPDVIYLQWFDEDGEKNGAVTWCEDRINETDIEYRRLTIASTRPGAVAGLDGAPTIETHAVTRPPGDAQCLNGLS